MAITMHNTGISNSISAWQERISPLQFLISVGEEMHNKALSTKTYKDNTYFLTSSIGYGVFMEGKLVHTGGFAEQGRQVGIQALKDLQADMGTQPCVILVAAAPYSQYVERKGFVVLDGVRLTASRIVEHHKKELMR